MLTFVQCAVALAAGAFMWLRIDNPSGLARGMASLLAGFAAAWLVTFLWTWLRHGWKAARSLTMSDP